MIYHYYNINPIELTPCLKSLTQYEDIYTHNLFTNPYLIHTNYAKKFARFHKALYIWEERNIDKKKRKKSKPKEKRTNQL